MAGAVDIKEEDILQAATNTTCSVRSLRPFAQGNDQGSRIIWWQYDLT
jgi:hypothetical protein